MGLQGKQACAHFAICQWAGKEAVHNPNCRWAGWEANSVRDKFSRNRETGLDGGEKAPQYEFRVDVCFLKHAWAASEFYMAWADNCFCKS